MLGLLLFATGSHSFLQAQPEAWSFSKFVDAFNKKYADHEEYELRKLTFEKNVARMIAHNEKKLGWTEGVNEFSDLSSSEFGAKLGRTGGSKKGRPAMSTLASAAPAALPASVDWRDQGVVSPVKNQGSCGSCWAFASTEQIESYVAISGFSLPTLSTQELVSCDSNPNDCGGTGGCQGSISELAYEYVMLRGLSSEANYPYSSGTTGQTGTCNTTLNEPAAKISGFTKLIQNNYTDVLTTLATVGPLAVNVWATPFQSYTSGIFSGCSYSENMDINHVMQLVGYGSENGQDYWIVRNSWGSSWGESGYIRMARTGEATSANCGLDFSPEDGTGCNGEPAVIAVCDTCGLLWDASYPTGAKAVN